MSDVLILAVPSKGRLKDQVEAWLQDCNLSLAASGGDRGYSAELKGVAGISVRLLSAGDIAEALQAGEVHLGVTGEDLLRERGPNIDRDVLLLQPLGFGRADLVVATPKSWLDVDTMADLEDVAHDMLARTGRRMRVATKYLAQTRTFFARHGLSDYRIAESAGATEGAPAAGAAECVVDITTTGATLKANGLKILKDGVILKSQAHLAASRVATWTAGQMTSAESLLRILEARAAARAGATLIWPSQLGDDDLMRQFEALGASRRPNGLLVPRSRVAEISMALTAAGRGPVTVSRPDFVFESQSPATEALRAYCG
ncbi:MAG: ATP phosphoribosyltransferase [Phenylobacterium zucineum]|nr:MAG: ATP phosphoribosyltransferase [Phenylobacterium zucineum]